MKDIIGGLGGGLVGVGSVLFMICVASWMTAGLRGASLTPETAVVPFLGMISGLGMAVLGYVWARMVDSGT